jgi:hypothetical protein
MAVKVCSAPMAVKQGAMMGVALEESGCARVDCRDRLLPNFAAFQRRALGTLRHGLSAG